MAAPRDIEVLMADVMRSQIRNYFLGRMGYPRPREDKAADAGELKARWAEFVRSPTGDFPYDEFVDAMCRVLDLPTEGDDFDPYFVLAIADYLAPEGDATNAILAVARGGDVKVLLEKMLILRPKGGD